MHNDDIDAVLRLAAAGGAAAPRKALLDHHPSPAAALDAGATRWRACGLSEAQAGSLLKPDHAKLALARQWLAEPNHHLLGWTDPDYPPLLRRSPNAPFALFVAGDPMRLWHPSIAIVGSRAATPGGRDNAAAFARFISTAGFGVASGLAAGVDAAAHESALQAGGLTIAVLGTGPDVPYPRSHAGLHERIAAAGAIVSEHLPGTGARAEHFPSRNRILAGLSLGTLVVEAAERSGALITARQAVDAGREVFAIPGSIHNPLARGCHRLIRDGAVLAETAAEVVDALAPAAHQLAIDLRLRLGGPTSGTPDTRHGTLAGDIDPGPGAVHGHPEAGDADYQKLWKALGHDPTGMDQLVERTGLTPAELSSMLLLMELDGRVTTQHGRYHRSR
ncbi:MAG TPA: DNA-processing protein DprA [Lysobacter sp.]|nr:DNA-processing protein DprA [Lysobacter sp.]